MRDPEDRARVRRTIALAARMVESGDPTQQLVSYARIQRLTKKGKPTGKPVEVGPMLISWTPEWTPEP